MDSLLVIARLFLALVFSFTGLREIIDWPRRWQTLANPGAPVSLAIPLRNLLPIADLLIAGALISSTIALWGAIGALVLLLVLTAMAGMKLAGENGWHRNSSLDLLVDQADLSMVIRNEMLAAVAGLIVWHGWSNSGPNVLVWLSSLLPSQWFVLIIGVILLGLIFSHEKHLTNISTGAVPFVLPEIRGTQIDKASIAPVAGLSVGARAPTFDLPALHSERLSLDMLRATGKPIILIFSDPTCGSYEGILSEVKDWHKDYEDRLTFALVSQGSQLSHHTKRDWPEIANVVIQQNREVSQAYRVTGIPAAVMVRQDGSIGSRLALGTDAIRALVLSAINSRT